MDNLNRRAGMAILKCSRGGRHLPTPASPKARMSKRMCATTIILDVNSHASHRIFKKVLEQFV
jgi:hypothetical protein